jgi:hypothetical protein
MVGCAIGAAPSIAIPRRERVVGAMIGRVSVIFRRGWRSRAGVQAICGYPRGDLLRSSSGETPAWKASRKMDNARMTRLNCECDQPCVRHGPRCDHECLSLAHRPENDITTPDGRTWFSWHGPSFFSRL